MNCLTFSIRYKIRHKNSKIHMESHLANIIKLHGVDRSLFRYFRFLGFHTTFLVIFEPHFYVVDGNYRYDHDNSYKHTHYRGYSYRYTTTKVGEPVHGYERANSIY